MTSDLFDEEGHGEDFGAAFASWLHEGRSSRSARPIKLESSAEVYASIWEALTRFALAQRPPPRFQTLSADDLLRFVESRDGGSGPGTEPSAQYIWRVLSLIGRVHQAYARRTGNAVNDAALRLLESRPDWRYANSFKPLPETLSAADAKVLVTFLSSATRGVQGEAALSWQDVRNRAAVALHLGAGLRYADLRELKLASVVVAGGLRKGEPWKISVPAHPVSPAREAPVAGWAARMVRRWLDLRAASEISGDFLFPAKRTGQQWGKVAHYNAVRSVLESAGVEPSVVSGGAYRLRHTFAVRQLRRGRAASELAAWLGVSEDVVKSRYRRIVAAPVADLA